MSDRIGFRLQSRGTIRQLVKPLTCSLGAFALVLVIASVAAGATVAPTPAERNAIVHAFGDPTAAGPCLMVRLAASNRDYGEVGFRTRPACERWAFNGTNVLKRGSAGHWAVLFEGSSYHCPLPRIPRRVQHDLGVCPS
jgi:hypothetical protein